MSIFEELEADQKQHAGGVACSLCLWLADRPDRDEWDKALAEPTSRYSTASITRLARKNGYGYGGSSVKRHRTGHISA
jgi:hypothetical protein